MKATDKNLMFCKDFFEGISEISEKIDTEQVTRIAKKLSEVREHDGRLFIIGAGGSAGNASHAVNDFRKLCQLEAYSPTDNTSELTARINDEGWDTAFIEWLRVSKVNSKDAVLVFSVGGGSVEQNVSVPIIKALEHTKQVGGTILGIVGRDGGYTKIVGEEVLLIPTVNNSLVTPFSESFQAVVWHCLVSHPLLQVNPTKW